MQISKRESFRRLAIQLRNDHLQHCPGADCNVSLDNIRDMAEAAGVEFGPEERKHWHERRQVSYEPCSLEAERKTAGPCKTCKGAKIIQVCVTDITGWELVPCPKCA